MRRVYLLGFLWGWSFFLVKKSLPGFTPWSVAFGRTLLGALTLIVILQIRGLKLPRDGRLWRHLAVLAVVSNAIPIGTQSVAQAHITSTLTSVLNATTPLFTALIAAVAMNDRLRRPQVVGLVLGFFGVVIAAGLGGDDVRGAALFGVILMLVSTLSYGVGFNYARRNITAVPPAIVACGQQILGAVLLCVPAVVSFMHTDRRPTLQSSIALSVLGIVCSGVGWMLNFTNIGTVGAANASAVTFLVPVVAFLLGVGVLNEPLRLRHLIGGAVTLFGVALLQERFARFRVGSPLRT